MLNYKVNTSVSNVESDANCSSMRYTDKYSFDVASVDLNIIASDVISFLSLLTKQSLLSAYLLLLKIFKTKKLFLFYEITFLVVTTKENLSPQNLDF